MLWTAFMQNLNPHEILAYFIDRRLKLAGKETSLRRVVNPG
jgi:hypothetical protein